MRNPDSTHIWADDGADAPVFNAPPQGGNRATAVLAAFAERFGFGFAMIADMPVEGSGSFQARLVLSNWPAGLIEAYDAADVFSSSALVRALLQTRLPVFNEGCLLAETGDADTDGPLADLFCAEGLCATLAIRLGNRDGDAWLLVLSGTRDALSQDELAAFTYGALEFLESLEKNAMVTDTLKDELSARELACLRFAAEGKSSDDIAVVLGVSAFAISSYFKSAAEKLDCANRMQAVARAIRMKLI